ncbi:hypothetical protein TBR22_A24220 [Luteitalea sp. TBR-22]|uniref:hypothetical protein n=1 Tax=Luteitalea sp. TBR-22 TaxID=2802971 RepID=UPI001AF15FC0|nr:hypothetical protein [Luteitalea sp. TBR-22]BCS33195.1 hypothetical protein TBR22_A24220 [Luteitalea sp. TBR-22]
MPRLTFVSCCVLALGSAGLLLGQGRQASPATGSADEHAYFASLVGSKDHVASYSLRDPAQLKPRQDGGYAQSAKRPLAVTYAPGADTYPLKQDAAKILISQRANSLPNQVRLPLRHDPTGFVVTWDAWWGEEFQYAISGIEDYKAFQLESGGRIWTEVRARFRRAQRFPRAVAVIDVRQYGGAGDRKGSKAGGVKFGSGGLGGIKEAFAIAPATWTRYWVRLTPRPGGDGRWDFSLWVADETRDPVLLYDKEGVRPNEKSQQWERFWLEYNTSTKDIKPGRPELVAYARNVVVLRPTVDMKDILRRPIAKGDGRGSTRRATP